MRQNITNLFNFSNENRKAFNALDNSMQLLKEIIEACEYSKKFWELV